MAAPPDPLAFPSPSMWTGRAALYRPAPPRPGGGGSGPPPASSSRSNPPGHWLIARAPGTLVIEDACIRLACGGLDAIRIDLTCADVAGAVLTAAEGGEGGGGGRVSAPRSIFAASATYTDAATGRPHALKFAFRLERPDDGPRLAAAWRTLKSAAEAARAAAAAGAAVVAAARPQPSPLSLPAGSLPSLTIAPGGGSASLDTAEGGAEAGGGGGGVAAAVAACPPGATAGGAAARPEPQPAAPHLPPPIPSKQGVSAEEGAEAGDAALEDGIRALLADPAFVDYVARVDAVWGRLVEEEAEME